MLVGDNRVAHPWPISEPFTDSKTIGTPSITLYLFVLLLIGVACKKEHLFSKQWKVWRRQKFFLVCRSYELNLSCSWYVASNMRSVQCRSACAYASLKCITLLAQKGARGNNTEAANVPHPLARLLCSTCIRHMPFVCKCCKQLN